MITNEQLTPILESILNQTNKYLACYIAGSLCINIEEECIAVELTGIMHRLSTMLSDDRKDLSPTNHKLAFDIYLKYKGETEYYRENMIEYMF